MKDSSPTIGTVASKFLPGKLMSLAISGASIYFSKRLVDGAVQSTVGINPNPVTLPLSLIAVGMASRQSENKGAVMIGGLIGIALTFFHGENQVKTLVVTEDNNMFVLHNDKVFFDGKEVNRGQFTQMLTAMVSTEISPEILVLEGTVSAGFADEIKEQIKSLLAPVNGVFRQVEVTSSKAGAPFDRADFVTLVKIPAFKRLFDEGILTFDMGE